MAKEEVQGWKKRMTRKKSLKESRAEAKAIKEKKFSTKVKKVGKGMDKISRKAGKFRKKIFKKAPGRKRAATRARGTGKLLTAMGVSQGKKRGAGRPHQTYKYGMPIQEWKRQQTQKRALYNQYQAEQQMKLRRRGLTKEQIVQLQQARTQEEFSEGAGGRMPMIRQRRTRRPQIQRQVRLSNKPGYPQPPPNVADDELRFRKWMADKTVSPNTQRLLTQIRRIQNKGKVDNIEQQRRNWERKLVGSSMNLMRAHENMNKIDLDFTGVNEEENILMAPSVFKEKQEENILRTNKLNLMQTREAGNNLQIF